MCSRPQIPVSLPPKKVSSCPVPPKNQATETHKARAKDALLSIQLLLARRPI